MSSELNRRLLLAAAVGGVAYLVSRQASPATPTFAEEVQAITGAYDPYGNPFGYVPPDPAGYNTPTITGQSLPGGRSEYDNQLLYACNMYSMTDRLAPLLLKAIIRHESGFNPTARGDYRLSGVSGHSNTVPPYRGVESTRDYCSLGLGQVNRCAHPDLALRYNLLNPNENILAAAELLSLEYRRYWPDYSRVAVGYNGPALAANGVRSNAYSSAVMSHFRPMASAWGVAV